MGVLCQFEQNWSFFLPVTRMKKVLFLFGKLCILLSWVPVELCAWTNSFGPVSNFQFQQWFCSREAKEKGAFSPFPYFCLLWHLWLVQKDTGSPWEWIIEIMFEFPLVGERSSNSLKNLFLAEDLKKEKKYTLQLAMCDFFCLWKCGKTDLCSLIFQITGMSDFSV